MIGNYNYSEHYTEDKSKEDELLLLINECSSELEYCTFLHQQRDSEKIRDPPNQQSMLYWLLPIITVSIVLTFFGGVYVGKKI